ncbi:MAG: hypothetical protein SGJ19_07380 [Planctomycetia bacterium]|nr:hypothetical protein [Planctomycetia bacterium]
MTLPTFGQVVELWGGSWFFRISLAIALIGLLRMTFAATPQPTVAPRQQLQFPYQP